MLRYIRVDDEGVPPRSRPIQRRESIAIRLGWAAGQLDVVLRWHGTYTL
jgi:hypothetical protein